MLLMLTTLAVLASTDVVDLVDPVRLLIMLLPEHLRGPAAVVLTTVAVTQAIASLIVARLPLSARQHPRYGGVVRALHWYSVLRLRDELGSTKLPGADVAPRVTVAPTPRDTAPHASTDAVRVTSPTSAALLTGEVALAAVDPVVPPAPTPFDPTATITVTAEMHDAARKASERGYATVRALLALVVGLAVVLPVGVAVLGCGPRVIREPALATPPDGCVAGATTCHDGAPWRCSGGRWSQADRQCARLGTDASPAPVCCLTQSALREDAVVHACVPQVACIAETP